MYALPEKKRFILSFEGVAEGEVQGHAQALRHVEAYFTISSHMMLIRSDCSLALGHKLGMVLDQIVHYV